MVLATNSILLYFCLKLFSVLMDCGAKLSENWRIQINQLVMKDQDLNLSLCMESDVIALKETDFIHCFTLDGGFA